MKKIFIETQSLDKKALSSFLLSEEILMENAAAALEKAVCLHACKIRKNAASSQKSLILIVAGSGGNGADGYTLARRIACSNEFSVAILEARPPKTELGIKQRERALACGVRLVSALESADILVDCLFGSGFSGALDAQTKGLIEAMNSLKSPAGAPAFKIACDVPSGLGGKDTSFCADLTVCMGALKEALFTDIAADLTGKITTASLGVSEAAFTSLAQEDAMLLEESDLSLPVRDKRNVHKGTFGHSVVFCGGKPGATITAALAASAFGSGLSTLVPAAAYTAQALERFALPFELMLSNTPPKNATAFSAGMGLLPSEEDSNLAEAAFEEVASIIAENPNTPAVLDADFFSWRGLLSLLQKRPFGLVLTPHPKEFASLLKICSLADISAEEAVKRRFSLSREFCASFPGVVLVAKGAIPVIGFCPMPNERVQIYANPLGSPALAKGGTGDVLAGLICALLAQGFSPLEAAISASLAHALSSRTAAATWGLSPSALIEALRSL